MTLLLVLSYDNDLTVREESAVPQGCFVPVLCRFVHRHGGVARLTVAPLSPIIRGWASTR